MCLTLSLPHWWNAESPSGGVFKGDSQHTLVPFIASKLTGSTLREYIVELKKQQDTLIKWWFNVWTCVLLAWGSIVAIVSEKFEQLFSLVWIPYTFNLINNSTWNSMLTSGDSDPHDCGWDGVIIVFKGQTCSFRLGYTNSMRIFPRLNTSSHGRIWNCRAYPGPASAE